MKRVPLFPAALLLSLALHAGAALWLGAPEEASAVEIDLTRPILAGAQEMSALVSPAPTGGGAPGVERSPSPSEPAPTLEPLAAEAPAGPAAGAVPPEEDRGLGPVPGVAPGEGGWSVAVRPPLLLHADRVRGELRRLYPEEERRAGREGEVVADLRVDAEGRVLSVEIVRSAGAAFDEAAGRVLGALRFSPAMAGTRPVGVKVRQRIAFRLD